MTRIIDLPTAGSVDSSTFVPVFQNGKTKKASASSFGGGGGSSSVSDQIHAATIKSSPADADELGMSDSAASWGLKKITFANLKAWIAGMFVSRTNAQIDGNLNITGTARRITGDFSNATASNRLLFQTSVGNGNTTVGAVPNGSGGAAGFAVYAKSDVTNSEVLTAYATATSSVVAATKTGSGNFTPLLLLAGDLERLRIDPTTGNVLATSGVLGYGVGAGGTVVQATSKSTAVTLNKPSGFITMTNSALASGAVVAFVLNNSFIGANDLVVVQPQGGAVGNEYQAWVSYREAGACIINVLNNSAGSRSEAVGIQFNVFLGVIS